MKKIQLGTSDQKAAAVILGCMRINNAEDPVKVIETAYENGIDFFDHADIYGNGECECSSKNINQTRRSFYSNKMWNRSRCDV